MMDRYTLLQKVGIYAAIAVFLTFVLLPFFEMFMASLRPLEHLFRSPYQFWSDDFSFDAYSQMWVTVPLLGRYIWNSIYIASMVTGLTMIFVIPAAYAFARLEFPFKNATLAAFLGVNMFTGAVLLIPLYRVLRTMGLLNTYWAMIVPGVAFLIPTGIWLLRSYLEKNSARAGRSRFCGWCNAHLHPAPCGSTACGSGINRSWRIGIHRRICPTISIRNHIQPRTRAATAACGIVRIHRLSVGDLE